MAIYVESGYVESGYVEGAINVTISNTIIPLNITLNNSSVYIINVNLQTIICKIDNINIKAVLDNEFPIPKIDINQDITNTGFLDYSNLFSNEISNNLILDWVNYNTVEKIKKLDYNIKHSLYRCNGLFLFDIDIISIEYEEIYRGALWYNIKINYKRITDG